MALEKELATFKAKFEELKAKHEGKFVLMERKIHYWGSRVVNGVRQLEESYQQVFMPPNQVEKKEKQGWYRVEDQFDVDEVLRKEEKILDSEGRDIKKSMKRPAKTD